MRILYCDVDTLRADHTGPYGYSRSITPNLDRIAQEAVVFESCYTSDSPCAPSRAALSSGQFGITSGAIANFGPGSEIRMFDRTRHAPLFGGHLYRNGIYTASISSFPERHLAYWFLGNFREWIKPTLSGGDDEDAKDVTKCAVDWLRHRGREDNWFLQVHYWDPHIPYFEDQKWRDKAIESGEPPQWPDAEAVAGHAEIYGPHTAIDLYEGDGGWNIPPPLSPNPVTMPDSIRTREDFVHLINGYDGAIMYWDYYFGQLLDTLSELGVLEDTVVIVASDHGECFGENGCYGDHPMANEPSHHIPMVIRWPGITDSLSEEQRRASGLVYQLDLCPTLCDLLGISIPIGWDGESFAAAVRGDSFDGRDHLILSHGAYTYQRSVRTQDHLYVRTLHPGCWRLEPEQLYEISTDPHMTNDLFFDQPALASEMSALFEEWRDKWTTMAGPDPDPMIAKRYESPADAFSVERYLLRLEGTGRKHLAQDLRKRLASDWVTKGNW